MNSSKKVKAATILLLLSCLSEESIDYGRSAMRRAQTNHGLGRGVVKNKRRQSYKGNDVYNRWSSGSDRQFKQLLHITQNEFDKIVGAMRRFELIMSDESKCLTFENQILLTMYWIVQYPRYSILSSEFGISEYVVSKYINATIPYMVEHFIQYIPNKKLSDLSSSVSQRIIFVIDGTAHMIQKPSAAQHRWYRNDKNGHWIQTLLLVDFDGNIIAFSTNYPGRLSDSACARRCGLFQRICFEEGQNFALGDPGFQNVDYVVAGLKSNMIHGDGCREFLRVTRSEQIVVEHVNCFIKTCRSLSTEFRHNHALLTGCVFVACGMFMWKKGLGHYC